ncbi:hypothetical protein [Paenibacillus sp. L3-i20]|uniref:hypothetical protein n=1 Tax=Paenibacillus sp. L3-i20 TaxID=2905833 RepID=UPI001EDEE977|nr:hypothetical protein [Paenibacillus sp. L3-i20]GKU79839.1 hypothetical protein L3i20_v242360 [Paenibacillus sp. L3-i20]
MIKVFYENILVGEVITNQSMTVEQALEAIGFDEDVFLAEHGWDDLDYNEFRIV